MKKRTLGAWALVAVLLIILVAAVAFAYRGMTVQSDFQMPTTGYVALGLGAVLSLIVGVGLMALVFYSSRAGYDDSVQREPDGADAAHDGTVTDDRTDAPADR